MNTEKRIIYSSLLTGISEMIVGLIMMITGWHTWYYNNFHFFGIIGFGMFLYGGWHWFLWRRRGKE